MCWRDDVHRTRICSACGEEYFGDLGHPRCPGPKLTPEQVQRQQDILAIGERHGWDLETTREKIRRTGEILSLDEDNSISFLLEVIPMKGRDPVDKLEEEHPPF